MSAPLSPGEPWAPSSDDQTRRLPAGATAIASGRTAPVTAYVVAAVVGVGLLIFGLIMGLSPIRVAGTACGNAFSSSGAYPAVCDEVRTNRQPWTYTGLVVGLLVGGGGLFALASRERLTGS